jgi:hypothetical protein
MKSLSKQKFRVLAKANGWSLAHAEGYVDGQTVRRRGKLPSKYALIGIDEYCMGFRAGYFDRQSVVSSSSDSSHAPASVAERVRPV